MPALRTETPDPARLRAWRAAAYAVLLWEALAVAAWPALALLAVLASAALLGSAALLPGWLAAGLGLAGIAGVLILAWRAASRFALPHAGSVERRLERDSGLAHRPFAVLRDRPADFPAGRPAGTPAGIQAGGAAPALWLAHQARARRAVTRLRLRGPDAGLPRHDPHALRAAALLLLAAALVVAGPQAGARLSAALLPGLPALAPAPSAVQAWIQPPAYTGLPPVFLPPGGGDITVPAGARLTISVTGASARPRITLADAPLAADRLGRDSFQATALLTRAGTLAIGTPGLAGWFTGWLTNGAAWSLHLIADEPPVARWSRLPGRAGTSLATALPWQAAQRWGVASLQAELLPKGHPGLRALKVPLPLPGAPKQASGEARPDLSADPYAGLEMTGRLLARDVSGQRGQGAPADFILPARSFHHPLARAIAELRRRLALHPDRAADTAAELAALGEAPVSPPVPGLSAAGTMLNLAADAALLSAAPSPDAVAEAQGRLWTLALALDGALPDAAAAALQEARDSLQRGLDDHARGKLSDRDLAQKLQTLRQALDRRLQEMARQAQARGALQNFDPKQQHLSSGAIDRAIQKLERALQEGRTEDARQAMAQLNRMMDQLKNAHIMTPEEARRQQEQARQARQQKGAVEDMVQRETTLLDHAQARAPHAPDTLPPFDGGQIGRQDLLPDQPPDQSPDQSPDEGADAGRPADPFPPPQRGDEGQAPPPDQPPAGQKPADGQSADARTQRALHRALDALKQGLAQSGRKPPPQLDDAGRAMQDAAGALAGHDDPTARDAVSRAIAALQQGGQAMSREQQGEGGSGAMQLSLVPGGQNGQGKGQEDGDDNPGDGQSGTQKDPFGRKVDGNGALAEDPDIKVPDQMEQGRSRAIQEELRRRGADRARSRSELDYIDRLLKPF